MDDFITIYYWVRLAVLVVVTVLALGSAVRMSGRRAYKPWREALFAVLALVMVVALSAIVGVTFGPLWAGVLALVGAIVGFLVSRGPRVSGDGGRAVVRRPPLVPWVWSFAVVVVVAALLFAESYTFSLSMLLLAFAVGLVVGETVALLMGARDLPAQQPAAETGTA